MTESRTISPLVSIIVPVHDTERFLRRCLDSLVQQTLKDIEIIVVNDHSPDSSQAIIEEYARMDKRINTVLHETSRGCGAARNSGIEVATGEYLGFVDSDDWVCKHMYEKMVRHARRSRADLVECNIALVYPDRRELMFQRPGRELFDGAEILDRFAAGIHLSSCNKIIKRSLWTQNKLSFPHYVGEDQFPMLRHCCYHAKRALVVANAFYRYRKENRDSITTRTDIASCIRRIEGIRQVIEDAHDFLLKEGQFERFAAMVQRLCAVNYRWLLNTFYRGLSVGDKSDFVRHLISAAPTEHCLNRVYPQLLNDLWRAEADSRDGGFREAAEPH